jgi:hypothetical protein
VIDFFSFFFWLIKIIFGLLKLSIITDALGYLIFLIQNIKSIQEYKFYSHPNLFALIISLDPSGKIKLMEPKGFPELENLHFLIAFIFWICEMKSDDR